jgi:hypothetical protein
VAKNNFAYFAVMKEALNRSFFPNLEEDARTMALMGKLNDGYRLLGRA